MWEFIMAPPIKKEEIAIIVYGNGKELGDFKIFSNTLKSQLEKKYKTIVVKYVRTDRDFFDVLKKVDAHAYSVSELHILSHSIGAGIYFGYGDSAIGGNRVNALSNAHTKKKRLTYEQVLRIEVGGILTDNLAHGPFMAEQLSARSKFTKGAFIKIWGCNSGLDGWVYSDSSASMDPIAYYWRALNEKHVPKPSIARAMAKFFNVRVFGASSGASIEVQSGGKWMSSAQYRSTHGNWPSGVLPHRLVPDKGTYREYLP